MTDTILVTGGAGYIGSHTCLRLAEAGFTPVVYDNLSNGHARFVQWGPLEVGDIRDSDRLAQVMDKHRPALVIHFAALIEVGESVKHPGRFFDTNVRGAIQVIEAARAAGVQGMVFSSTCATYGEPERMPMDEGHRQAPLNPYGRSKLMVEQALADYDAFGGFRSICLRYFNAAGADPQGRIGERHDPETHAIPLAVQAALGRREGFKLFGTDYDTPDGTAVRDYVHVLDLADAHVLAAKHLLAGGSSDVFNLGTGAGFSVKQLLAAIERRTNRPLAVAQVERREGDAPTLVADARKAERILGWRPRHDLDDIVRSAYDWHARHEARVFAD